MNNPLLPPLFVASLSFFALHQILPTFHAMANGRKISLLPSLPSPTAMDTTQLHSKCPLKYNLSASNSHTADKPACVDQGGREKVRDVMSPLRGGEGRMRGEVPRGPAPHEVRAPPLRGVPLLTVSLPCPCLSKSM